MANTNALYNAAYIGALSGISSRWLSSEAANIFPTAKAACVAYATAVDAILGVIAEPDQADVNLLQQISSSFWEERMPVSTEAADYAIEIGPLCDLFISARSELIPGGVGVIGSDNVINESGVPGTSGTLAFDTLANDFDDYAFIVSMFGMAGFRAFTHEQASVSNNDPPALILTPTVEVNKFTIGPDDRVYSGSNLLQGIAAYHMPLRSGVMNRWKAAHMGAGPSGVHFYNQAPATGVNPWSMFCAIGTGGQRVNAGLNLSNIAQSATMVAFTLTNTGNTDGCFDLAGNYWYTGASGGTTVRINVNGAGGVIANDVTFVGSNWPAAGQGVAIDGSGNLYRSNYVTNAGSIRRVNAATIAAAVGAGPLNQVPDFTYTVPSMGGIEYIFFDHAGNLWGVAYEAASIFRINVADLGSSGAKIPDIVLGGGGTLGNGNATGPVGLRPFKTFGPLR
jgi:hypothetical protein